MASISEKTDKNKCIIFRFRTYVGKDENGKKIIFSTTWRPPPELTKAKARKAAEIAAYEWETSLKAGQKAVEELLEERKPKETFENFVKETWIPLCVRDGSHRPSTVEMYTHILNIIVPYFGKIALEDVNGIFIAKYLSWLRNEYRTANGRQLADKTIKHHYNILRMVFNYAEKQDLIIKNPIRNVFKCNDYHDIEEITATVNVLTPFGDTIPVTVDAGYCSTCDCYFILTRDYERLRQQGVLLCRVIDEEIFRTKWHLIKNGMDLNEESVLHQYGYSVNQKDNLSDIQRREILSKVIDEGLYTVPGLKSFLDWLIERARKARNRNMDSAIEKWQSDRNWIAKNLSSPERDVEISSIHKKTYW